MISWAPAFQYEALIQMRIVNSRKSDTVLMKVT